MKLIKLGLCLFLLFGCSSTEKVQEEEVKQLMTYSDFEYVNNRPSIHDQGKTLTINYPSQIEKLAVNYEFYKIYDPPETQAITELENGNNYKVVYYGKDEEPIAIWIRYEELEKNEAKTNFTLYDYTVDYGASYLKWAIDHMNDSATSPYEMSDSAVTLDGIKLSIKIEDIVKQEENTIEGTYFCNSLFVNVGGEKYEPLAFVLGDITWTTFRADYGPPYFHAGKYKQITDEIYQFIHYPIEEKDYFIIRDGVLYYPIDKNLSVEEIENTTFTHGCTYNTGWIEPTEEIRYISKEAVGGKEEYRG